MKRLVGKKCAEILVCGQQTKHHKYIKCERKLLRTAIAVCIGM